MNTLTQHKFKSFLSNSVGINQLCLIFHLLSKFSSSQNLTKCDPASQNQQKVAWPSFVLWLEIGDQGQHG